MMSDSKFANVNGSMSTASPVTVESTLYTYNVLLVFSEPHEFRVLKIAAHDDAAAKILADQLYKRLYSDQLRAISVKAEDGYANEVEIVGVHYNCEEDSTSRAWTSADAASPELDALVQREAA